MIAHALRLYRDIKYHFTYSLRFIFHLLRYVTAAKAAAIRRTITDAAQAIALSPLSMAIQLTNYYSIYD